MASDGCRIPSHKRHIYDLLYLQFKIAILGNLNIYSKIVTWVKQCNIYMRRKVQKLSQYWQRSVNNMDLLQLWFPHNLSKCSRCGANKEMML